MDPAWTRPVTAVGARGNAPAVSDRTWANAHEGSDRATMTARGAHLMERHRMGAPGSDHLSVAIGFEC